MANIEKTSPANREYCVFANYIRRLYLHVTARSPAEARQDCWEDCFEFEDRDNYRLSDEVKDLETGEYVRVAGSTHCKNCGGEIVEEINDSNFSEGECGPCEYERYRSHSELLEACESLCGLLYRDKNGKETIDCDQYERAEKACRAEIERPNRKAE